MNFFKPQKVKDFYLEKDSNSKKYKGKTFHVMEKYDGWYGYRFYDTAFGWSDVFSSSGKRITALANQQYYPDTDLHKPSIDCVLIFELYHPEWSFSEICSNLKQKMIDDFDIQFYCHDLVILNNVYLKFSERYRALADLIKPNSKRHKLVPVLDTTCIESVWMEHAEDMWKVGKEGIILKDVESGYYVGKRNYTQMKVKEIKTIDLKVGYVEFTIGVKGKEGCILHGIYDNIPVKVAVNSKKDKDFFRPMNRTKPENLYIEISYMEKTEKGALRHARFIRVREDKPV